MIKKYIVKFKREPGLKVWGLLGNRGPYPWEEIVKLIHKAGVSEVKFVRHADKGVGGANRLEGKEMLELWKAVHKLNA